MAKKSTEALYAKWQALEEDQKLTLQLIAAFSDKGVEDEALIAAAADLTEDLFVQFRLRDSLGQLQTDAATWFVKSPGPGRRKLRAAVRKALPDWQGETPYWPLRHPERLFDAISLMARDDLQSACDNYFINQEINKRKYFLQIEFLYPELLELRAAEAAAILTLYYGLCQNAKKYAEWREDFGEWVENTPLPQTPLLFLGILPENQQDGTELNLFRKLADNDQHALHPESNPEDWNAERAEALAEYLRGITPGDQASRYCALTLRALAARPAWFSDAPPELARERLGDYGPVVEQLPALPDPPYATRARRQSMMLDLFGPLAARIEDYFGDIGPGCRYVFRAIEKLRVDLNHQEDEDQSLAFRYRSAMIEISDLLMLEGGFNSGSPLISFGAAGSETEAVRNLRAAYPEWFGRQGEMIGKRAADTFKKQAALLRDAKTPKVLAERLIEAFKFIRNYHQPANRRYFFALADLELADSPVKLMDLSDEARELRADVGFEIAKTELLLDPAFGVELARGFTELLGADSPEARDYMLMRLADFYQKNGLPGQARRLLDEWRERLQKQPGSPELFARLADVSLLSAVCLAETGRVAEMADDWQAAADVLAALTFDAKDPAGAVALGWKVVNVAKRAKNAGAAPDLRPALAAAERKLLSFERGAAAIPGLRARVYLEMSDNPLYSAGRIQNGLISAGDFIKEEWNDLLDPEYLKARPLESPGDDLLLAGNRYLGVLSDELFRKYAARRPIRMLMLALLAHCMASRRNYLKSNINYAEDSPYLEERLRQLARAREKAALEMRRGWPQYAKELEEAISNLDKTGGFPDRY